MFFSTNCKNVSFIWQVSFFVRLRKRCIQCPSDEIFAVPPQTSVRSWRKLWRGPLWVLWWSLFSQEMIPLICWYGHHSGNTNPLLFQPQFVVIDKPEHINDACFHMSKGILTSSLIFFTVSPFWNHVGKYKTLGLLSFIKRRKQDSQKDVDGLKYIYSIYLANYAANFLWMKK